MVLSFKTHFPDGTPTDFVDKILRGEKRHTMRQGHRWWPGQKIHMATGVRSSNYHQFNCDRPDLSVVKAVQNFYIDVDKNKDLTLVISGKHHALPMFYEDSPHQLLKDLARNDGFASPQDLFNWFRPKKLHADFQFHGQIIHWTDLVY